MSLINKQSVGQPTPIRVFGTAASMQVAVDAGSLVDGDIAFVTAENSRYFVEAGAVFPINNAVIGVDSVASLPAGAQEGDLALDQSTSILYEHTGGQWLTAADELEMLEYLKYTYEPLVLLGFDERTGSIAADVSGNGHDFTHQGVFTLGQSGFFGKDGRGVLLEGGSLLSPYPAAGPDHSFVLASDVNMQGGSAYYLFDHGPVGRIVLLNNTGVAYHDGVNHLSGYETPNDGSLFGYVFDSAAGTGTIYINGLPFYSDTYTGITFPGTQDAAISARYTLSASPSTFTLFQHVDGVLTDAQQYDIARKAGAVPPEGHYFREKVRNDLCIHRVCVAHHPLWEKVGTQAIDVSGKGNHGTYVGSPVFGVSALSEGFLHSIGGETGYVDSPVGIDVASGDWTIAGAADPVGSTSALFKFGGTDNYIVFGYLSGSLRLQGFDGAEAVFDTIPQPITPFTWCVRRSGDIIEAWVAGVKEFVIDISARTFASDTTHFLKNMGHNGWLIWDGDFQHHGTFPAALDDTICAALSTGTVTPSFAPEEGHYFTEVIEDELGIADSCEIFLSNWEASGTELLDISGSNKHATVVGALTLQQPPKLDSGAKYSVLNAGTYTGYKDGNGAIDASTGLTIGVTFRVNSVVTGGVLTNGDTTFASSAIRVWHNVGETITYRYYDSAGAVFGQQSTSLAEQDTWSTVVVRFDPIADTLDLWVDGVKQPTVDISAATHGAWAGDLYFGWDGNFNKLRANTQHEFAFNAAHTDAICARLSEGTVL